MSCMLLRQGVKVKWIAAGSAACHSVIGDAEGRCWTWGRNEVSQPDMRTPHMYVNVRSSSLSNSCIANDRVLGSAERSAGTRRPVPAERADGGGGAEGVDGHGGRGRQEPHCGGYQHWRLVGFRPQ